MEPQNCKSTLSYLQKSVVHKIHKSKSKSSGRQASQNKKCRHILHEQNPIFWLLDNISPQYVPPIANTSHWPNEHAPV
jgi:hypothetical protein